MEVDDVFLCVQLKVVGDEMILQSHLGTEKYKPDPVYNLPVILVHCRASMEAAFLHDPSPLSHQI